MNTSTWMRRSALLAVATAALITSCGGDDNESTATTKPASPATEASTGTPAGGDEEVDTGGGQSGSASFQIDGNSFMWNASCSGIRVIDGVTQPGVILQSAGMELTTGAFLGFTMEFSDGGWDINISDGGTGESWTITNPIVSEDGSNFDVIGEAFSTSNPTPRPFALTVTCP